LRLQLQLVVSEIFEFALGLHPRLLTNLKFIHRCNALCHVAAEIGKLPLKYIGERRLHADLHARLQDLRAQIGRLLPQIAVLRCPQSFLRLDLFGKQVALVSQ
jgi:hypothetical protein